MRKTKKEVELKMSETYINWTKATASPFKAVAMKGVVKNGKI